MILETGDEVMACLKSFVADQRIKTAQFSAIGALSDVVLMYFDWGKKEIPAHSSAGASRGRLDDWRCCRRI
ncbi:MAG: PPC domain-containing DNA-binding protein [Xanthobacteraceae bacterium]